MRTENHQEVEIPKSETLWLTATKLGLHYKHDETNVLETACQHRDMRASGLQ